VIEGAAGGGELEAALDDFRPAGDVLELACGPGTWTVQLLRHAAKLTALDASPEMLALAAEKAGGRVRFVQADLFEWEPDRRYDVVFFGFWLSHVPLERFDSFWSLVADAHAPGGRVFFADDGYRTPDELIEASPPRRSGAASTTAPRTGSSRCGTSRRSSSGASSGWAGTSPSPRLRARSSGARAPEVADATFDYLSLRGKDSNCGARTRTLNSRARTWRVADYSTPHRA
jgi:SAM-dependent methyltransferase